MKSFRSAQARVRRTAPADPTYRAGRDTAPYSLELLAPTIDLPRVNLRSRLLTALNLLPWIATLAFVSRPNWRQRLTKLAHTLRIAGRCPCGNRQSPCHRERAVRVACVYRKPKPGRSDGEVRQISRAN